MLMSILLTNMKLLRLKSWDDRTAPSWSVSKYKDLSSQVFHHIDNTSINNNSINNNSVDNVSTSQYQHHYQYSVCYHHNIIMIMIIMVIMMIMVIIMMIMTVITSWRRWSRESKRRSGGTSTTDPGKLPLSR